MERSRLIFLIWSLLACHALVGQQNFANLDASTAQESIWVDSVYRAMTPQQRVGQLFMIRAHSNLGADHVAAVERMIRDYHIGGLCFFQGAPAAQIRLLNRYQAMSRLPMMVAMDAEWGLGMRMKDSTMSFPRQQVLGALRNNYLVHEMGKEVGRQLRRVGVHINFAPVADVNNNAGNPVIGTRSFGEDRVNVTLKSIQYMKGLQEAGVMACAKHFPGHGDTDMDSHHDLPRIDHPRQRLDSIELYPFRGLIEQGIGSVMVGHLEVPALDARPNRPTTLSENTVTHLLRRAYNFHGLTFTDGLDMQGVTKNFSHAEIAAEALLAGNDVLLLPPDLAAARSGIERYVAEGRLSEEELEAKIKRVLRAKYRLGLQRFDAISTKNLYAELSTPRAKALEEELIENALTLVRNNNQLVPIDQLEGVKIGALAIGTGNTTAFQRRLLDYAPVSLSQCGSSPSVSQQQQIRQNMADKDIVIVSLHAMNNARSGNYGLSSAALDLLEDLRQQHPNLVVVVFGTPYSLHNFESHGVVLMAYQEDKMYQDLAAQAIFGAIGLDGRLPVSASPRTRANMGVSTRRTFRLGYSTPERVGMRSDTLQRMIGKIVEEGIKSKAMPGCVVLVARHGKIVYEEAFGRHTYDESSRPVEISDIYDLASVTKVAATTLAIMDLVHTAGLDIDEGLGTYLPEVCGSNKETIPLRNVMAHRGGLKPWIPFYQHTLGVPDSLSPPWYSSSSSDEYPIAVADRMYLHQSYMDSIWHFINLSDLRANENYKYSDLGFYYLANIVKEVSGQRLDEYMDKHFYMPLGLHNIGFLPQRFAAVERIPPTEIDTYWRKQKVQGFVHDMGAAMLGGVSGHAGLFGSAHDVSVLAQMLLQRGSYGNRQYLQPDIVRAFTTRFENDTRRGLGFDMKELSSSRSQNTARSASQRTFGHTGFTGTCFWADPDEELIVVFLSNRTYPSMNATNRLARMDIRERIQQAAYDAIFLPARQAPAEAIATKGLPTEVHSMQ